MILSALFLLFMVDFEVCFFGPVSDWRPSEIRGRACSVLPWREEHMYLTTTHTHTHTHTHIYIHTHTHTHRRTNIQTHKHIYVHKHSRKTHCYTHTETYKLGPFTIVQ